MKAGFALALALGACTPSASSPSPPLPVTARPAPAPPPPPAAGTALPERDARVVAQILARVSKIRGLTTNRAVPAVKLTRQELVDRVKDKAIREYPADALRREGRVLQLLGLAPQEFDYLAEMGRLLAAQLDGFYDPKNGTMFVASELKGPEGRAALAHELVHALQDQHFDLEARSEYRKGYGDETLAAAALSEGDATSAMIDFALDGQKRQATDLGDDDLRATMRSGMQGEGIAKVPRVLRATLIAPYAEGVVFVNALRRSGGWPAVDEAWRRLPKSTEQVLHAEKWKKDELPLVIPPPTALALGAGFTSDDEDSFGELGLALLYGEWMSEERAMQTAAGWGGDRATVLVKGDEIALAIHLRYDAGAPEDALAKRGEAQIRASWKHVIGAPESGDAAFLCFDRPMLGPLFVTRKGRDLVIGAGPANLGATFKSTGTCATARTWAAEVLAN